MKTFEKMKPVLSLAQFKINPAVNAFGAEGYPLFKQLLNAHNTRNGSDKDVEITRKRIFKRSHLIKLRHKLVGIGAAFKVDSYFKTIFIRLITDIADFFN